MAASLAVTLYSGAALGEVYVSDPSMEISGTGPRISRTCTVILKPAMIYGADFAPRLVLRNVGPSRLFFGVEKSAQYSILNIVQDNIRKPLVSAESGSTEQFLLSNAGKAIRSGRLFFVTARRSDTAAFASSRYEHVDFDKILTNLGAACPFDAESMMTDLSSREREERALSISSSDLALIRWALGKKYSGTANKPEAKSSLSELERSYLKRYATENGLPQSKYLTSETARRLTAEGQALAGLDMSPPTPKQNFWSFNDSKMLLRAESGKPERIFVYDKPSREAEAGGVIGGAVAFKGVRNREQYIGIAYDFSRRCSPAPYEVTGTVSEDQRQVMLYGMAPLRDAKCKPAGSRHETLIFRFHDEKDNWGEPLR